jgi:transposase
VPDDDDARVLFELADESAPRGVAPAEQAEPGGPVRKTIRAFVPGQDLLLPPSLDEWLPAEHLARFIAELVDEHLDLSRIHASYTKAKGAPPYDPRLMVRILLYGYTTGVRSSRQLEAACQDVVAFRWLAAGQGPDFRSIARFRKRHLSALGHLFTQALVLCQAAGMVTLGRVALDGTKVRANASRRKAISYARMSEKEKVLAHEVSELLAQAEAIDQGEDARFGRTRAGTSCRRSCGGASRGWPRSGRRSRPWRTRLANVPSRRPARRLSRGVRTRTPPRSGLPTRSRRRCRIRRRSATSPIRSRGS